MKKTPLNQTHKKLGAKMIEFGGWEMPVQYKGIIEEHNTVRNAVGLFDVSHMGEIYIKGPDARKNINYIVTNDVSGLKENQIVYSPMCYDNGGTVDDLLIYNLGGECFLLVVNASNTEKDFEWIKDNVEGDVVVENRSEETAQLALQGPKSEELLQNIVEVDLKKLKYYNCIQNVKVDGIKLLISRTGYTGEDGFEIYLSPENAVDLWDLILEKGKPFGIQPAGLGARDTLRFEAGMPLYGHEINEKITPIEAKLGYFVKTEKDKFIGKKVLEQQKKLGPNRILVGFEMIDRGIPRQGYEIHKSGQKIGFVTSGSFSPTLKKNLGLGLIDSKYSMIDEDIDILIRGKKYAAKTVKTPFYRRKK
ncbi:MAG: aminomethyltransferase [Thermosediminibacterales bacterium]|nr:aminomethyltransferase [Thermosediminibacterales bacterium]